ncbi:MAG: hypothetical protein IAE95_13390 [Chitinophagaceae bacterium]|nr:hypothetical protein [Chitinophagaceae bacterium]
MYRFLLTAFLLSAHGVFGQTVLDATRRCWSGGIAGRHGCDYTFSILFKPAGASIVPEKIWVDGQEVPLLLKAENGMQANVSLSRSARGLQLDIAVGSQFDDGNMYTPASDRPKTKSLRKHAGVALLAYKFNGKMKYFTVKKIMVEHPPVSYP